MADPAGTNPIVALPANSFHRSCRLELVYGQSPLFSRAKSQIPHEDEAQPGALLERFRFRYIQDSQTRPWLSVGGISVLLWPAEFH
jgi:hypothetical protein